MMTPMSGDDVVVRPARRDELPALAEALVETSAAQLENRWREQELGYRELLLAEQGGAYVGTVSIGESESPSGSLHLFALEVAPARRGQGIGGAIVRHVLAEARRRNRGSVYLEVRVDNPARRLYQRLGFRRTGGDFINTWWRFKPDGTRDRIDEISCRMITHLAPAETTQPQLDRPRA
jgi:ribosomal protein S18 acetylase RimI-like enzyme